jgi:N-acetylglucosamine-6-phosphate deacetylase
MRIHARHYETGELVEILCEGSRIKSVAAPSNSAPDVRAGWAAPALFDLQINGCDGRSFNSDKLTVEDVRHVVDVCRRHGLSAFCPTLITNGFAALVHGFTTLARACEGDASLAAALPAFHLEGPYISAEDGPRGAHP